MGDPCQGNNNNRCSLEATRSIKLIHSSILGLGYIPVPTCGLVHELFKEVFFEKRSVSGELMHTGNVLATNGNGL